MMLCTYNYFFSDIYFFNSFFILFLFSIFFSLSKLKNFPNIYKFTCVFIGIFFLNIIVIDNYNMYDNLNSFDIYKTDIDILVKWILIFFTLIFIIYTFFYINKMNYHLFEYSLVIYFISLSFNFFISSVDLLSFYLLLEIQSLCFYLLTAFSKHNQYSVESGLKYFILSSFSSVCLLFGYSYIYGITGSLNFNDILLFFSNFINETTYLYGYFVINLLILVAFLFKLYIAPFHVWISDIYQGAPTMTTAYFGTITSFPLFYVFIKFFITFFYWIQPFFVPLISVLSIFSMFLGLIGALYQKKIKRLIAYSSVSNVGYLMIGFIQESPQTLSYSITYILLYILNSTGIFIIFTNLYLLKYSFFLERFNFLAGIINKNKLLSIIIIILFFTAAGIPPFSLFLIKILILTGMSYNFYSILLFILILSAILSSFYYLRIIKIMSFDFINKWVYFSQISYINYLILVFIVLVNFFFLFQNSKLFVLSDFIIISLY